MFLGTLGVKLKSVFHGEYFERDFIPKKDRLEIGEGKMIFGMEEGWFKMSYRFSGDKD